MDERKPSIPPSEFRLRSASEWTSADIDPPPAVFAKSDEPGALERQSRSGQIEPCRDDFSDRPSVAVYYRNEEEVSEGFLIAQWGSQLSNNCPSRQNLPSGERSREDARFSIPAAVLRGLLVCMWSNGIA